MPDTRKCKGTNRDGGACAALPRPGSTFCQWHDPDIAEERATWQKAGGRAKANSARARKKVLSGALGLDEVDASLCVALTDVLKGELQPNVAGAAATLARAITAVRQAGTMEDRLQALEAVAGIREEHA